jgi:predicted MFS family arabinose efflux permease
VLYEASFATLAQISITHARRAIIYLSFFGGLASTFSWPITRLLHDSLRWRETMLIYAGLAVLVCLPIHIMALLVGALWSGQAMRPVNQTSRSPPNSR